MKTVKFNAELRHISEEMEYDEDVTIGEMQNDLRRWAKEHIDYWIEEQ